MKVLDINTLKPPGQEVATFQGVKHGANVSFFVVHFPPGKGPRKHRHPYEETFIILEGQIEAIVNDKTETIHENNIVIIPAGTWHEFKNLSEKPVFMVNIHPVPEMLTEWA
ncbi:MAG TPA: cupin domain-containing protein [Anaerolineales bacterium]|nr:cupin domain-containing protein [Anaerolineales bacterium]